MRRALYRGFQPMIGRVSASPRLGGETQPGDPMFMEARRRRKRRRRTRRTRRGRRRRKK